MNLNGSIMILNGNGTVGLSFWRHRGRPSFISLPDLLRITSGSSTEVVGVGWDFMSSDILENPFPFVTCRCRAEVVVPS